MRWIKLANIALFFALFLGGVSYADAPETIKLIKSAAQKAASVQAEKGNDGAIILIAECVRDLRKNGNKLKDAEVCATYDWVISQVTIAFFSNLGAEAQKDPSFSLAKDYPGRIATMLLSVGRTRDDPEVKEFIVLLKKHALDAFAEARLGSGSQSKP